MNSTLQGLTVGAFLALGGFALSGCTDLDTEVLGATEVEIDLEAASQLPLVSDPQAAYVSGYNGLRDLTDQGGVYALMEHTSDELIAPTRGTDWYDAGAWQQLHAHTWTPTNPHVNSAFRILANGYFAMTRVIAASSGDANLTARAKFVRAFYMSHMVDLFGQVPFREATEGIGVIPKTLSRSEAFDLVVADLNDAISNLPELMPSSPGMVSKQAAQALLARMHLNRAVYTSADPAGPYNFENSDMDRVIELADQIMSTSGLSLQPAGSYFDLFSADNSTLGTEMIFALEFARGDGIGASAQNRYRMTTHYNQDVSGWNGFTTIADFYNKWDQDDERFRSEPLSPESAMNAGFLQGQQFKINDDGERVKVLDRAGRDLEFTVDVSLGFSDEASGVRVIKYYPDFMDINDPANDYIFLRLADVVLMKAEAQLRKGDASGAIATVNMLRASRDGAEPLASVTLDNLLDERGFEMYWEGIRRMDQIRFGAYLRPYAEKNYQSDPRVFLFPIPLDQLTANPNLVQNPGY